jgi:hypothetical protein
MRRGFRSAAAILLLAGCGVTEIGTPGTKDQEPETLARVRVPVHQDGLRSQWEPAHLQGIEIDGVDFALGGETRDFWLLPGLHRIHPRYEECLHWPKSWFHGWCLGVGGINTYSAPFQAAAGRSYELRCVTSWNSGPWVQVRIEEMP